MPTADQLRSRIASYGDLHSIVKTMKALSAASIRQFEEAALSLKGYDRTVGLALRAALDRTAPAGRQTSRPLSGPAVVVAFGSNHGLCGRFNDDVAAAAADHVDALAAAGRTVSTVTVGARLSQTLARLGIEADESIDAPGSVAGINSVVQDIMVTAQARLSESAAGTMSVVYAHRTGTASYRAVDRQVVPAAQSVAESAVARDAPAWPRRTRPMLSMPASELVHLLRQQQLFVAVYRACADSQASEHSSRLLAMTSAQRNVEARIVDATAQARHFRQDAVTAELLDVVAGYEALRQD